MMNNSVTLVGNLTRDPELKYTTGGTALVNTGLAWNRRYQKDGEWQEEVSFFNLTIWGEMGENVAASLGKGSRVIVFGSLQQRSWETDEREKRSVIDVKVDSIGPDLRWAQCEVSKTEREKPTSGGSSGGRVDDPVYSDDPEPF